MTQAQVLEAILRGDHEVLSAYTGLPFPRMSKRQVREMTLVYATALRLARTEDRATRILDRAGQ